MALTPSHDILGMRVDGVSFRSATKQIMEWARTAEHNYVCVANVHMCMETRESADFQNVVNGAGLVVADGKPLVWLYRLLTGDPIVQIRGADLLISLCRAAGESHVPIGLYGGTADSLKDFQRFLHREFPDIKIACAICPPFRPLRKEEDSAYVEQIKSSGTRILFVGIGCPKQEYWMATHRDRLHCVQVGIGAAFDFFSGRKRQAPRWMQWAGLEWAFRLMSDPRRLWKRYLKHNPRFLFFVACQWVKERITIAKSQEAKEAKSIN